MQYTMRLVVAVVVMVMVVVMGTVRFSHARPNHTLTKYIYCPRQYIAVYIVHSLYITFYK